VNNCHNGCTRLWPWQRLHMSCSLPMPSYSDQSVWHGIVCLLPHKKAGAPLCSCHTAVPTLHHPMVLEAPGRRRSSFDHSKTPQDSQGVPRKESGWSARTTHHRRLHCHTQLLPCQALLHSTCRPQRALPCCWVAFALLIYCIEVLKPSEPQLHQLPQHSSLLDTPHAITALSTWWIHRNTAVQL